MLTTLKDNYNPDWGHVILGLRFGTSDYDKYLIVKDNNVVEIILQYPAIFNADEAWLLENRYPVPYEVTFNMARRLQ